MTFYKMRKHLISLVCVMSLLLSVTVAPVGAVDTNRVTATTNATVQQGNYGYCYVSIDSTENLASLELAVHFDPAKLKISNVYNSVSCTLYDSVVNADNIQFSYLLDKQGTASQTSLFYFQYQVLSNAELGDAYFDITVGEAIDSAMNDAAVSGSRCKFTIAETVTNKTCYVYGNNSVSTAIAEEFTLDYRFSTAQIASGTAVITYDPELFEVVEAVPGAFLSGKVVDINADLTGEIYISFVGTEYSSSTELVTVTFKTIKNVTETAKITLGTPELHDKELNAISCSGYTTTVDIAHDPAYTGDAPEIRLSASVSKEDKQITVVVTLEADSHLGAGDFVIVFDPELVAYHSSTKEFSPSMFYVDDKKVADGELKFHVVSTSDIVTEETILSVVFDLCQPCMSGTVDFTLNGTGTVNSLTQQILLNFINDSVWVELHSFGAWSDDGNGNHIRNCVDCGSTESAAHTWIDGSCTECETDDVSAVLANGELHIRAYGLDPDSQVLVAFYGENDRMTACKTATVGTGNVLDWTLDVDTNVAGAKVLFVGADWAPIRKSISLLS